MFDNLTEENFQLFAMKHYENPHCCEVEEFYDDIRRIRYIKRLFGKYRETGELKDRLVLNHLVILYNLFEHRALTRMLFLKLEDQLQYLKPFLVFLQYWPTDIGLVNGKKIIDSNIPLDYKIIKTLRQI